MTGMSNAQIPAGTNLPNFGSVPMPDDLINFAWHKTSPDTLDSTLMNQQVETQAAFSLPIAYVRVPAGYTQGQSLDPSNVIDIRPFFRTAELTYSERAAVAAATMPNGDNPLITQLALDRALSSIIQDNNENNDTVATLEGELDVVQTEVNDIKNDLYGTGTSETASSKNFEGRILNLEASSGAPTGGHKTRLLQFPVPIAGGSVGIFGTLNSPKIHGIGSHVLPQHQNKVVAGLFRVVAEPQVGVAGALNLRIGATSTDTLISNCVAIPNLSVQPEIYHSFPCKVNEVGSGSSYSATVRTATNGSDGHQFVLWLDGYIYEG